MTKSTEIAVFDPKTVATFGNQMLNVIVAHEAAKDQAEAALRQADEREKVIDFELTQVALHLHKEEKIDLFTVFEGNKAASSKLYRTILIETGALVRKIDEESDTVSYDFTDEALKGKFDFSEELKEKDEEEFKARRSRRNALNIRLQRVCKAAAALVDAGATTNDMTLSKGDDGTYIASITKGPKEVMGKEKEVTISNKSVPAVDGASLSPTITGLAKHADAKFKPQPISKETVETGKGGKSSDTTEKDFMAIMNTAIMALKAKEGNLSEDEKRVVKNFLTEVKKCDIK